MEIKLKLKKENYLYFTVYFFYILLIGFLIFGIHIQKANASTQAFNVSSTSTNLFSSTLNVIPGDIIQIWGASQNTGLCSGCIRSLEIKYKLGSNATTSLITNSTRQNSGGSDTMPPTIFGGFTATTTDTLMIELDTSGEFDNILMGQIYTNSTSSTSASMSTTTELALQGQSTSNIILNEFIIFFLIAGLIIYIFKQF